MKVKGLRSETPGMELHQPLGDAEEHKVGIPPALQTPALKLGHQWNMLWAGDKGKMLQGADMGSKAHLQFMHACVSPSQCQKHIWLSCLCSRLGGLNCAGCV